MEFSYRAVDKKPTPNSCRTYSAKELEQKQGHFQIQDLVREVIQSELEMEKIKKDILDAETGRRRVLDDWNRDIMIQRGLALGERRVDESGMLHLETGLGFNGRGGLTVAEELSLEERISRKVEERIATSLEKRIAASLETRIGAFLEMKFAISLDRLERTVRSVAGEQTAAPFGKLSPEKIEEVVVPQNEAKKKDKQIFVKDQSHSSGEKRKAVSPIGQGANESTSANIVNKTVNKAWACSLCQISTTNKDGLYNHVQGKKHKSMEAALKLHNEVKDTDNGVHPNKKAKIDADVSGIKLEVVLPKAQCPMSEYTKSGDWNCLICEVNLTSKRVFDDHIRGKKHKRLVYERKHLNKSAPKTKTEQESCGKNVNVSLLGRDEFDLKCDNSEDDFKGYMFWCKTCNVGANSEVVMETHRKGKKHLLKMLKDVPLLITKKSCKNSDDCTKDEEIDSCKNVDVAVKDGEIDSCKNGDVVVAVKDGEIDSCKNGDVAVKDGEIDSCKNDDVDVAVKDGEIDSCKNGDVVVAVKDGEIDSCKNGDVVKDGEIDPCKNDDVDVAVKDGEIDSCKNGDVVVVAVIDGEIDSCKNGDVVAVKGGDNDGVESLRDNDFDVASAQI